MITKNGELIKEEPHTTALRKQLHFNVSLQWISLHAIFGKKTLLFWSGHNYIKVDMYIFNIKSRMQIAHTLLIKDL